MIGISKLYCGTVEPSDALRYGRLSSSLPSHLLQFSSDKRPVVVWNITRQCNLRCVHCYAHAKDQTFENELSFEEGKALIDDLAGFGVPVLLFSGGEPMVRKDLPDLAAYAVEKGMRAVISTNGTLITAKMARTLKEIGLSYVGISLDGMETINDRFRGVAGAFNNAMKGIRNCQDADIKVGLRFTINKANVQEIPPIFDILEEMDIPRVCFYHLVYAGRGSTMVEEDLSHAETRAAVDLIMDRTKDLHDRGKPKEVLTVDNHADGPYLYMRMLKEDPERAKKVLDLLKMNEGNNSGRGIGCVSWDGSVHPDQFWRHHSFGNIKDRPFSEIWTDLSEPLMGKLK
ncbi:MAG: 12,18-didecarboxysiroheme deacetylase, partial [Deltaproteobacteria bacterium]|nr:12,18-didecarboxysiroheme deacetylase [Deltaproteobacteria bacterium]